MKKKSKKLLNKKTDLKPKSSNSRELTRVKKNTKVKIDKKKVNKESLNLKLELENLISSYIPGSFRNNQIDIEKIQNFFEKKNVDERFEFTWVGKNNAKDIALKPSKGTLSPDLKKSINFDKTENIFIEGDSLESLKLLSKSYFNQIKVIYIDPLYSLDKGFVYSDSFKEPLQNYLQFSKQVNLSGEKLKTKIESSGRFHSQWLSMVYPRISVARNLLKDDGVMFISIDDAEVHHLKYILNDIFDEKNFIQTLKWKRKKQPSYLHGHVAKQMEYVHVYAKNIEALEKLSLSKKSDDDVGIDNSDNNISTRVFKKGISVKLDKKNSIIPKGKYTIKTREWEYLNDVEIKNGRTNNSFKAKARFRCSQEDIDKFILKDVLFITKNKSMRRLNTDEELKNSRKQITDLLLDWGDNQESNEEIKALFPEAKNEAIFDYPKPKKLIKNLISSVESKNEIILDFFAGSGTTADAVIEKNQDDGGDRKFIVIQLPEPIDKNKIAFKLGYTNIAKLCAERIKRVIKNKSIDSGFKYFKLDKSNYIENNFEFNLNLSKDKQEKEFKQYLNKSIDLLNYNKINKISFIYENILKEGFSLNSTIRKIKINKNTFFIITNYNSLKMCISFDNKVTIKAIENMISKENHGISTFIFKDSSLTDSDKFNLGLHKKIKTF